MRALRAILLLAPLLLRLLPGSSLPPGLALAVHHGAWVIVLGALATAIVLLAHQRGRALPTAWDAAERALARVGERRATWALFVIAVAVFLVAVPARRWAARAFGGDEPAYLALASRVCHEHEIQLGDPEDAPPADGSAPAGRAGNWLIHGRAGGLYSVHGPALGVLLAPAACLQDLAHAEGAPLVFVTLGLFWAAALVQGARVGAAVSGSALAGTIGAAATALAPAFLATSLNVYPEVVAAAVIAWALVPLVDPRARVAPGLVARALALGALGWLHVKFLPPAAVLAIGLLWVAAGARRRTAVAIAATLPVAALLAFTHRVTGFWSPDGFYRVYGSDVYAGPGGFSVEDLASGLVNGVFAGRDGLLVMAPVLVAGALAIPAVVRRSRPVAGLLALVFATMWATAATHGGGAPGPPARLMTPVALVLAVPIAVAFVDWRGARPWRWLFTALALVSLTISLAMVREWRLTVSPYRALDAAENVSRDLPDAPSRQGLASPHRLHMADLGRAAVLVLVLALGAAALDRSAPRIGGGDGDPWPPIRNLHLAAWAAVVVLSVVLHAIGPHSGSVDSTSPPRGRAADRQTSSSTR